MRASQAIAIVEEMCGGSEGFTRVHSAVPEWDQNLEDFCLQRISPEQYVANSRILYAAYSQEEFNRKLEERLVNSRVRK